jgi:hypothetical protein
LESTANFVPFQIFEWRLFEVYLYAAFLTVLGSSLPVALPSLAFASFIIFNFSNLARSKVALFRWCGLCRKHHDQLQRFLN